MTTIAIRTTPAATAAPRENVRAIAMVASRAAPRAASRRIRRRSATNAMNPIGTSISMIWA